MYTTEHYVERKMERVLSKETQGAIRKLLTDCLTKGVRRKNAWPGDETHGANFSRHWLDLFICLHITMSGIVFERHIWFHGYGTAQPGFIIQKDFSLFIHE